MGGTAIALERTNRNRTHWKFGVEYLHRDFRYGPQCIPQRQYLAGVGYYVHLLHDRGYHVRVSAGGTLLVGYETVGGRSRTLYDGARLVNGDAVLWGGALSAELSAFLSDRVALSLEVAQRITAGSSVTLFPHHRIRRDTLHHQLKLRQSLWKSHVSTNVPATNTIRRTMR